MPTDGPAKSVDTYDKLLIPLKNSKRFLRAVNGDGVLMAGVRAVSLLMNIIYYVPICIIILLSGNGGGYRLLSESFGDVFSAICSLTNFLSRKHNIKKKVITKLL